MAVGGDALNKYPFVPGGATFDFPLCGGLVNSGWGSYNYLLNYGSNILAVDANGDMWAFPLSDTFVLGAPHKIGTGWDIYTTVLACGEQLLALDTNGDLWRYEFNPTAFWPLTGDEPVTPEEGDGILAE